MVTAIAAFLTGLYAHFTPAIRLALLAAAAAWFVWRWQRDGRPLAGLERMG